MPPGHDMTEVAFHFNVPDKAPYLCRLLRKAVHARKQALVCAPTELVRELDQLLWTFAQDEFIPHALADDPAQVRDRSMVVLTDRPQAVRHTEVMVNCLPEVPADFDRYERLIEVVGLDPQDRSWARERWKHYAQRGFSLIRHDAAAPQGAH